MKSKTFAIGCCFSLLLTTNLWAEDTSSAVVPPTATTPPLATPTSSATVPVVPSPQAAVSPKTLNKTKIINQIQTFSIAGNYSAAQTLLDSYKAQYGEDMAYTTEQARLWALNNQPTKALNILRPLLQKNPNDKTLLEIRNYAMTHPEHTVPQPIISDKTAVLQKIRTESLNGNLDLAAQTIKDNESKYGSNPDFLTEKARYLALSNQPKEALAIVNSLLTKDPNNKTLLEIRQYAITHPEVKVTPALVTPSQDKALPPQEKVLSAEDKEKTTLINKINTELLKGKYAIAAQDMKNNEKKYGTDPAFLTEKARYLALTNQSKEALATLEPLLKKDPNNKDLLTIKQYALSHPNQVASAPVVVQETPMDIANRLAREAEQKGNDPSLYVKASNAYTEAHDNKNALAMINKAVMLQPDNFDNLFLQAQLTTQAGDYKTAYEIYQRIFPNHENNQQLLLNYARVASYYNKLDLSAKLYGRYIKFYPNDPHPWLEAAYVQNFKGDFREAISLLDEYQKRFGQNDEYLIERARILATAARPTESLAIVKQLMPTHSDSYDLNYANTGALYYSNQPIDMFKSLARVNELDPNSEQTQGLNDFIRTPYRSNVGGDVYHSHDSDTVDITRGTVHGQYFLSPVTSIIGNASSEDLSADTDSGLNPIEGGDSLNLSTANLGMTHRFNSNLAVDAVAGGAHVDDDQNAFIYQADALVWVNEYFQMNLMSRENYYDVSPRAVSLGVKQNINQANFLIQPCVQCYVNINTSYSTFSDDNSMAFTSVNLMRTFLATQYFNLNLGVTGQWDGFDKQLNDGYYNPSDYKYYAGIMDLYLKQNDNVGYSLFVGLGRQKDETFTSYTAADDYGAKAYFGIYQNWFLVLSGGYSNRIRAVAANPNLGPYHVYALDAALTRRFN